MIKREEIERLLNARLNQILLIAESSLSASQFQAFRKLTLNEFGKNGMGKDLDRVFGVNTARHGSGRNRLRKEGGAS